MSEFTFSPPPSIPLAILLPPTLSFCRASLPLDSVFASSSPKTDPVGAGHFFYIGVTGTNLCPVLALRSYLAHRGSLAGPLFVWADRSPLTADQVNHYLRVILSRAGVSGPFSSHSFRIGAAPSAAATGLHDHLIQTLDRWTSQAYPRYIRTAPDTFLSVASLL